MQAQFNGFMREEDKKRKRMRSIAFYINSMNCNFRSTNFSDRQFMYCMNQCCFTEPNKKEMAGIKSFYAVLDSRRFESFVHSGNETKPEILTISIQHLHIFSPSFFSSCNSIKLTLFKNI